SPVPCGARRSAAGGVVDPGQADPEELQFLRPPGAVGGLAPVDPPDGAHGSGLEPELGAGSEVCDDVHLAPGGGRGVGDGLEGGEADGGDVDAGAEVGPDLLLDVIEPGAAAGAEVVDAGVRVEDLPDFRDVAAGDGGDEAAGGGRDALAGGGHERGGEGDAAREDDPGDEGDQGGAAFAAAEEDDGGDDREGGEGPGEGPGVVGDVAFQERR